MAGDRSLETKAIHPNEQIALDALVNARSRLPESASDVDKNELDHASFAALQARMGGERKKFHEKVAGPLGLEDDFILLQHETALATISGIGNCGELAGFAFDHVCRTHPEVNAEVIQMVNGNHVVLVVGRKPGSNPKDPASWGDDAFICDPLEKTVYQAKEYQDKLKAYVNPFKFYIMQDQKRTGKEFYVLGLGKGEPQDPSTWPPDAYICDKEGKKTDSAHAFLSGLRKSQQYFESSHREVALRAPFDPKKHVLVSVITSKQVLEHHRKPDVLVKNYNSKLRIITTAVIGLIDEFIEIARSVRAEEMKQNKGKTKSKDKQVIQAEKDALGLLKAIDNLVADVRPVQSNTKTYRRVRESLLGKLGTAIDMANKVSSLSFFSEKTTKEQKGRIATAHEKFSEQMDKLKPKKR